MADGRAPRRSVLWKCVTGPTEEELGRRSDRLQNASRTAIQAERESVTGYSLACETSRQPVTRNPGNE